MGCCPSNLDACTPAEMANEVYMPAAQCASPKRRHGSRLSVGSSGIFSRCSTPSSRRSVLSSGSSSSSPSRSLKPKPNSVNYRDCGKDVPMFSICDDFDEAHYDKQQQQQHQLEMEKSFGYFSGSLTSGSPTCTPTKSRLRCTQQDNSAEELVAWPSPAPATTTTTPASDLEMEMYMMTHAESFMPKTSSPLCNRRDAAANYDNLPRTSASYNKWRNYLQQTPAYMLNNVTRIPEAIAGHFCPTSFPAFSELGDMESAAKRYKVDVQQLMVAPQRVPAMGVTHTIAITSTEL